MRSDRTQQLQDRYHRLLRYIWKCSEDVGAVQPR